MKDTRVIYLVAELDGKEVARVNVTGWSVPKRRARCETLKKIYPGSRLYLQRIPRSQVRAIAGENRPLRTVER